MSQRWGIGLVAVSLALGVICGQGSFLTMVGAGIGGISLFLLAAISFTVGTAQQQANLSSFGRSLAIAVVAGGVGAAITFQVRLALRMQKAERLVFSLHQYQEEHGYYPRRLGELSRATPEALYRYTATPDRQAFSLSYDVDGWHLQSYHSRGDFWEKMD